jgi:cyclic pyranopterin phosphate synthase
MQDSRGRRIEYLRLSLTGRCNLACVYCRGGTPDGPGGGPGSELSAGEIKRLVPCLTALGINKLRLTGGEPLLRRDLEDIVAWLGTNGEIRDLAMTTNGQGLARRAEALKKAGLGRVNISLDSLKPGRYREITGGGRLEETLNGVRAALDRGLSPVKINCVIMRGRNDDEAGDFIALAREQPLHVRFIELMPFGAGSAGELRVCSAEILASHRELKKIKEPGEFEKLGEPGIPGEPGGGSAELYSGEGFLGSVGFISPMSRRFCDACGRVRITADCKLKPCLGDNAELDLRPLLDGPDAVLRSAIEGAIVNKPAGHRFGAGFAPRRTMDRIGG